MIRQMKPAASGKRGNAGKGKNKKRSPQWGRLFVLLVMLILVAAAAFYGLKKRRESAASPGQSYTCAGYLVTGGYCLTFDREGILREIAAEPPAGLLAVTGPVPESAVLGKKLVTDPDFDGASVLSIDQFLQELTLNLGGTDTRLRELCTELAVDAEGMLLDLGDIRVRLGSEDCLYEKLLLMEDMLPELWGRTGTLYLDSYTPERSRSSYVFRPE